MTQVILGLPDVLDYNSCNLISENDWEYTPKCLEITRIPTLVFADR